MPDRPVLRVISFRRRVFRLSERAVVTLTARGKAYSRSFKAGLLTFPLRATPRRYTISAQDAAGNVSRTLRFP